jgi:outer membrane protein OmpA-like peptidoglycan-associated protein
MKLLLIAATALPVITADIALAAEHDTVIRLAQAKPAEPAEQQHKGAGPAKKPTAPAQHKPAPQQHAQPPAKPAAPAHPAPQHPTAKPATPPAAPHQPSAAKPSAPVRPQHPTATPKSPPAPQHPTATPKSPPAPQHPTAAPKAPATPQHPTAAPKAPATPQHPTAAPKAPPTPQHPTAAPKTPPAPQHPTARQPARPQQPTAQQPVRPQTPTAQQPARPQTPTAQQRRPENPAAQQARPQGPQPRRLEDAKRERHETHQNGRTVITEPGRTIIRESGHTIIRHDDAERFRRNARDVHVEHRGKDTVTTVLRPDNTRIIDTVDERGRLLRRVRRDRNGHEVVLIENRHRERSGPLGIFLNIAPPVIHIPRDRYIVDADRADRSLVYDTLVAPPVMTIERRYSLDEIRFNQNLRERMPRIDLDTITFDTGSWEIAPDQARRLEIIAEPMRRAIERNPDEIFLIEGHTDATGDKVDNLSLSDRRAEAVAEVLTQDFGVPPENLVTQGYGEDYLKVNTPGPEPRNRRVTVRRITPLLARGG